MFFYSKSYIVKNFKIIFFALICIFMGCLIGSMGAYANIYPFDQMRYLKNAIVDTYLSPKNISNPRYTLFKAFGPKAEVVMIGDSLTEWAEWSEIFPAISIANRGVSKDGIEEVLSRVDTILSVRPKKSFVMIGINNLYKGDPVDSVFNKYVTLVERLQENGIQVYIQSTVECSRSKCGEVLYKIRGLNKKLESYASASNIQYININHKITTEADGLLDAYTYDGTHLLGSGYLNWRDSISRYILTE